MVRILWHYTLKYSQSNFFHRGTIINWGTLLYACLRLKFSYRIGPWLLAFSRCHKKYLMALVIKNGFWFQSIYLCTSKKYFHQSNVKWRKLNVCFVSRKVQIFGLESSMALNALSKISKLCLPTVSFGIRLKISFLYQNLYQKLIILLTYWSD